MLRPDTIAIIDVGSNAVRLFVAQLKGSRAKVLADHREPLRLGKDAFHLGRIQPQTLQRLIHCLWSFRVRAHRLGAAHLRAVGTSALRDSKNSAEVLRKVWAKTGIQIDIIDGLTEAHLLYRAVKSSLSLKDGPHLLADLGGGSLELVVCDESRVKALWSLQVGTVRLLKKVGINRTYNEYARAIWPELGELAKYSHFVQDIIWGQKLIGTGGNFRALLRLFHQFHMRTTYDQLSIDDLQQLSNVLFQMKQRDLIHQFHLKPDRADVIRPATAIILELMKVLSFDRVVVPNVGIKNGLYWELADRIVYASSANKKLSINSTKRDGFSTLQQ